MSHLTFISSSWSSPLQFDNLGVFIDPSVGASVTKTVNSIDQINDLSGAGNHMTATGGNRPSHGTRNINGVDCIDVVGGQELTYASGTLTGGNTDFYGAFIVNLDGHGSYNSVFFYYGVAGTSLQFLSAFIWNPSGKVGWQVGIDGGLGGQYWEPATPVLSGSTTYLFEIEYEGSTRQSTIWVDGTEIASSPFIASPAGDLNIGQTVRSLGSAAASGSSTFDGRLGEHVLCNARQPASYKTAFRAYAYDKYAVPGLAP